MKIYIGSDHTGFKLKAALVALLEDGGNEVDDKGAYVYNADDDYPDFITPVAQAVAASEESRGIVIGGSGQGEAMCANRTEGARAVAFYGPRSPLEAVDISGATSDDPFEIVRLGREHNNANILSLGCRFMSEDDAKKAVQIFLEAPFSNEARHARRISKF